jgi:hypothetical protein
MTETVERFPDRPRGEDVERGYENEGSTEDVEPEREGDSVEGGGSDSGLL